MSVVKNNTREAVVVGQETLRGYEERNIEVDFNSAQVKGLILAEAITVSAAAAAKVAQDAHDPGPDAASSTRRKS